MSETPLEKLIATMCDTSDYIEAEIREELAEDGIDLDAEKAKFLPKLDALMAARAGRRAIEALKATAPSPESPLPWQRLYGHLCDANRDPVRFHHLGEIHSDGGNAEYAMCAVNAAPHLLARVAELEAEKATLQSRFDDLLSAAQEVAEVARLRGEGHLNPEDDPVLWTSRWNEALANLAEEVDK